MAHVGINDPSHFARDFRRHYGLAPTELRRRCWADEDHDEGTLLAPFSQKEESHR